MNLLSARVLLGEDPVARGDLPDPFPENWQGETPTAAGRAAATELVERWRDALREGGDLRDLLHDVERTKRVLHHWETYVRLRTGLRYAPDPAGAGDQGPTRGYLDRLVDSPETTWQDAVSHAVEMAAVGSANAAMRDEGLLLAYALMRMRVESRGRLPFNLTKLRPIMEPLGLYPPNGRDLPYEPTYRERVLTEALLDACAHLVQNDGAPTEQPTHLAETYARLAEDRLARQAYAAEAEPPDGQK